MLENSKELIAAIYSLEPLLHQLVIRNVNDPKNRLVQAQIDALRTLYAFRGQSFLELPGYSQLFGGGIVAYTILFAQHRTEF